VDQLLGIAVRPDREPLRIAVSSTITSQGFAPFASARSSGRNRLSMCGIWGLQESASSRRVLSRDPEGLPHCVNDMRLADS
jgi:hypothetical protein